MAGIGPAWPNRVGANARESTPALTMVRTEEFFSLLVSFQPINTIKKLGNRATINIRTMVPKRRIIS
jgi:hypothetical protein